MFFSNSATYPAACSPFRNTCMPLQDMTMNQTHLNNGITQSFGQFNLAPRSTRMGCGKSTIASAKSSESEFGSRKSAPAAPAPGLDTTTAISTRGRTMKDYEDQLDALQKENFQLKLRVYFLEEKVGMGTTADESGIKNNIELKMEVEALKKELVEKQELLCQAAKAFELHEEQKEITGRCQAQLERELEEYKQNGTADAQIHQLEEIVESLEAEVRQLTASLDEERAWAQELETERDQYKDQLKLETRQREKLIADSQQYKNELAETDRQLHEKIAHLDELSSVAEKRKKQIDQLRASVKSRDDALTDANNRYRTLLSQMENNHRHYRQQSSPPGSPTHNREVKQLTRELEERDRECKKHEEAKKQLILKLCSVQQAAEKTENDLQSLKAEHKKALKMIQGFIARQSKLEEDIKIEPVDDDDNLQQRFEEMEARINNLRQQKQKQTQNLQKLVNTELWNKNKEIAKLQRHLTTTTTMTTMTTTTTTTPTTTTEIGIQVQTPADIMQSDSETFSEPDRSVSQARIGLMQAPIQAFSDSEDSMELLHVPCHKTFTTNLDDLDAKFKCSMAALSARIKSLEEENKSIIRELDRTTLAHSQILVENTKLTNEKQRLEQELLQVSSRIRYGPSCSPDLGIESDASVRPLKDTLKITESMTNLLSDVETSDGGLEEVEILKKENEALKKRLIKTRRALEDTFEHLSASNKNKKNVEKAITKQLSITKSILKKTKTFEDT